MDGPVRKLSTHPSSTNSIFKILRFPAFISIFRPGLFFSRLSMSVRDYRNKYNIIKIIIYIYSSKYEIFWRRKKWMIISLLMKVL